MKYILLPITIPLGIVFFTITCLRNFLYDKQIMRSSQFEPPIILIGNLSVGGTGKTPHTEYVVNLLKDKYSLATLSRGYGRKTRGFFEVLSSDSAFDRGDEPLQIKQKFDDKIEVYICEDRVEGVIEIMRNKPQTEIIVLDDAFQHRAIKAGYSILLTDYNNPFYKDFILPIGRLRESRGGKKRADTIIVTKCPIDLSLDEQKAIIKKINLENNQKVFFSYIKYGNFWSLDNKTRLFYEELSKYDEINLVTAIANANPLVSYLKESYEINHLKFPDHHNFKEKDIKQITTLVNGKKSIILTTEKDAVKLKNNKTLNKLPIYYIRIEIDFLNDDNLKFDQLIHKYVRENKANS